MCAIMTVDGLPEAVGVTPEAFGMRPVSVAPVAVPLVAVTLVAVTLVAVAPVVAAPVAVPLSDPMDHPAVCRVSHPRVPRHHAFAARTDRSAASGCALSGQS